MSDNKQDFSLLVSKILEHPELVAQITGLLSESENESRENESIRVSTPSITETAVEQPMDKSKHENRQKLLAALRPFLSEKRRGALDSLQTVATIFEITKS